jgi:hypothetical protein
VQKEDIMNSTGRPREKKSEKRTASRQRQHDIFVLFATVCHIFSASNDFSALANVKYKIWSLNESLEVEEQKEHSHLFRERFPFVVFILRDYPQL